MSSRNTDNRDKNNGDNRRFNNPNGNNVNRRLKNAGDSSPNRSVPNPGTGNTRGNQSGISLRENLNEGMKDREGRQTRA